MAESRFLKTGLALILAVVILLLACSEGICAYFTIPESKLLDSEFSSTRWGGTVSRSDAPGTAVQFVFSGLSDNGTGLKDDCPVDTIYGQLIPSHVNGDFSNFSAYALTFVNLDTEAISVSLFINTGFTGPSGTPSNDSNNDTFWQSVWTQIEPGQRKIVTLYFDYATPWNIEDNPDPHTHGTNGVPTSINNFDRAEVSAIGFEVAGPGGNSEATILASPTSPSAEGINSFIIADGTLLKNKDNGRPWFYAGTNNYYIGIDNTNTVVVDEILSDMNAMNLNVLRLWGFNDDQSKTTKLQGPNAGDFIESNFQMLDYVLCKASQNGVRVIIPLVNYWDDYGGMQQYVNWNGGGTREDFYSNAGAQEDYKHFISYMVSRVNTMNGRIYKNDPTILAWQLANEPRYQMDTTVGNGSALSDWISSTSSYLRNTIEVKQLVTTGMEGFYDSGNTSKGGVLWMDNEGTGFILQHADANVSFAGFHTYQDQWALTDSQSISWIANHIRDARREASLGKPVIMDEFGRNTTIEDRNLSFKSYLKTANRELANGTNFRILYHDSYPNYDGFGVYNPNDANTVEIIKNYANKTSLLNSTGVHQLLSFEYNDEDFTKTDVVGAQVNSITRVDTPTWSLTGDGAVKIDCSFNTGDKVMVGAELEDIITAIAGINVSDYGYNYLIARIMIEDNASFDPCDLSIKLYNKTTGGWTYAYNTATDIIKPGLWYELTWPIATAGDLSDLKEIGIDVWANSNYSGNIYVDFIGGDLTFLNDNLFPKIDLDGSGFINEYDLNLFTKNWLNTGLDTKGDINEDQIVNFLDFTELALAWQYP
ncbi:MAG: cellulase family glycosylhydrolase [Sedimentisphaerales bacterium]|nr:cellulase family glycosylhydrolase [Sedimentisphaerales bacterium]